MKVLLLASARSIHIIRWANAFIDRGVEVHLATQHSPGVGLNSAVQLHRLPHLGGLGYLANGPKFAALVRKLKPDLVNSHYVTGYGTLARWCGDVPLVLNVWGSDVYEFPDKSPLHRMLVNSNLKRATRVVSTSTTMATRTRTVCPTLQNLDIVPFGVDMNVFRPANQRRDSNEIVIGTVKWLAPSYGIDLLIEAFAKLPTSGAHKLRLRIVGNGPLHGELTTLAQNLGVLDRTEFVGAVPHDQVADELRKLDIYVALSRAEGFGVAIVEASACGIPVVVSDAGGLPEVVLDGVTGCVVPRENAAAAANAISSLVQDATLRSKMGAAGLARAAECYEWSVCVEKMLRSFEAAIAWLRER